MIFGGGENQLTLIRAAKKLNLHTIVIDPDPDAPGRKLADRFFTIPPDNYEATRKVALEHSVDAIVTSQMENPLILMARLAEDLGYRFPGPAQILNCRNKYLMKQVMVKHRIPCARGTVLKDEESPARYETDGLSYPLVIKPLESHSSRGVFIVNSYEDFLKYKGITGSYSPKRDILLEECIPGKEYSVESLSFRGKTEIIQITEKFVTPAPYTVEIGHLQPALLSETLKNRIHELVRETTAAFKLDHCATHIEVKVTDSGPLVIEVAARLGGDFISSLLTLASTGIDMDEALIMISLGEAPDLSPKKKCFSYIKYLDLQPGLTVRKIMNWSRIFREPGLVHAGILIRQNQIIPEMTDSSKRPGFVLVRGDSREEVIARADSCLKVLKEYIVLN